LFLFMQKGEDCGVPIVVCLTDFPKTIVFGIENLWREQERTFLERFSLKKLQNIRFSTEREAIYINPVMKISKPIRISITPPKMLAFPDNLVPNRFPR